MAGLAWLERPGDDGGRRVEKVVSNSGDHDATWRYYYQGHQILQANDGSGNLLMQVYPGTEYIDEVVGLRLPHGRAYAHQDANWNVTSLTDLTGKVLERTAIHRGFLAETQWSGGGCTKQS